jgi:hypothetical protein
MRTGGSAGKKHWSSWQFAGAKIARKSFVPSACSTGLFNSSSGLLLFSESVVLSSNPKCWKTSRAVMQGLCLPVWILLMSYILLISTF